MAVPSIDPKWMEILKASGAQTTAVAIAFGGILLVSYLGWTPALPEWATLVAVFGFLLSGALSLTNFASALFRFLQPAAWIVHWRKVRLDRRAVAEYIPHMTERERLIVAYLLANNMKSITAAGDGGHAVILISRGILVRALKPDQMFDFERTPFVVPDHVWEVLVLHKDQFPYKAPTNEQGHPWRVSWMAR